MTFAPHPIKIQLALIADDVNHIETLFKYEILMHMTHQPITITNQSFIVCAEITMIFK